MTWNRPSRTRGGWADAGICYGPAFLLQVCAFGELDFAYISLVAGMSLSVAGLWMEVKLRWQVLADRVYTKAPTGKPREELYAFR